MARSYYVEVPTLGRFVCVQISVEWFEEKKNFPESWFHGVTCNSPAQVTPWSSRQKNLLKVPWRSYTSLCRFQIWINEPKFTKIQNPSRKHPVGQWEVAWWILKISWYCLLPLKLSYDNKTFVPQILMFSFTGLSPNKFRCKIEGDTSSLILFHPKIL